MLNSSDKSHSAAVMLPRYQNKQREIKSHMKVISPFKDEILKNFPPALFSTSFISDHNMNTSDLLDSFFISGCVTLQLHQTSVTRRP